MTNKHWSIEAITTCLNGIISTCNALETYTSKEENPLQRLLFLEKELESAAKACIRGCAYALYPNLRGYPDLQTRIADALRCTIADMLQELSRTLYLLKPHAIGHPYTQDKIPAEARIITLIVRGLGGDPAENLQRRQSTS